MPVWRQHRRGARRFLTLDLYINLYISMGRGRLLTVI